tara:strand:- start:15243 stop:15593 length:351 start_codon:yes stop_codon:yes gene_type:complete
VQITIELSEEDTRIARSIVSGQTHFVLNSHCLEDAVITGVLHQIHNNTAIWAATDKLLNRGGFDGEHDQDLAEQQDICNTDGAGAPVKEHEDRADDGDIPTGQEGHADTDHQAEER